MRLKADRKRVPPPFEEPLNYTKWQNLIKLYQIEEPRPSEIFLFLVKVFVGPLVEGKYEPIKRIIKCEASLSSYSEPRSSYRSTATTTSTTICV